MYIYIDLFIYILSIYEYIYIYIHIIDMILNITPAFGLQDDVCVNDVRWKTKPTHQIHPVKQPDTPPKFDIAPEQLPS